LSAAKTSALIEESARRMAKLRKVRFILVPVLVELYSSGAAKSS
jgi:hypothetical protein